jgi:hypothetical protein
MNDHMSQSVFDANEAAIRAAVDHILRNQQLRNRLRIFALCESGGKVLAEVFDTKFGPVIAHRSYGSIEHLRTFVVGAPRGRGDGRLVVAALTDDPGQYFPIRSRTVARRVAVRQFRAWIAEGKTEHRLPA